MDHGATIVRDVIIANFKRDHWDITAAALEGHYFSAADVAFSEKENIEAYRIIIIPHNKPHF